ncbi:HD domain-containing protein [uncultured Bacteroides sp.]|uniref:HD domain-containing protein n=1 Tax=uncultured Bacteroides sp. TaxID=162156 RepID=UPI00261B4184|nr:HD domain-containing protein [uncultured Bacteroides sp.]
MDTLTELKDRLARKVTDYYIENEPAAEQIVHTQSVAAYTRLIATGEGWDTHQIELVEIAAWLHDIGCPNSRRIYGNSLPIHQQCEGKKMVEEWLKDENALTEEEKRWLADAVGGHHQFRSAVQLRFEPLFEADLIVNLVEGYYPMNKARHLFDTMMTTATGKDLFSRLFLK